MNACKWLLILGCLFGLAGCHSVFKHPPSHPVVGAWEVQSITWSDGTQSQSINPAQPGMFIFNPNHYALMWSPKQTARIPFEHLAQPTDEEVLRGFKSIVFNAGAYQISGDELVATARVAKVPGFAGGRLFYRFEFQGRQLLLTLYDEIYPDGSRPAWAGKWTTTFTLAPAT
ncbi:lipocalin-like domain-containing protein [Marinicella meishanensis]|uniref:lipocalin-like domain-containing protein n=1 Tax=Marinicella meishanensis TaxID=2873263 RepID=UPI001CBF1F28|nr:lipocalin-like domain-containing protein [Marinicella sp. NBU2979]